MYEYPSEDDTPTYSEFNDGSHAADSYDDPYDADAHLQQPPDMYGDPELLRDQNRDEDAADATYAPTRFIPTYTEPRLTAADFDSARIDWSFRQEVDPEDDRDDMGRDPLLPGFIVRYTCFPGNFDASLEAGYERTVSEAEVSETEMYRLAEGTSVHIPEHFFVIPDGPTPVAVDEGQHAVFMYVAYIDGEVPDPSNPAHAPYLLEIGTAFAQYLETTPIGGTFASEYLHLHQFRIGHPENQPDLPDAAYLTDVDPVAYDTIDTHYAADDPILLEGRQENEYQETIEETYEWVSALPPSEQRDALLERLRLLQ